MEFDGPLGLAKLGPGKQRKTQVDRAGVLGVDRGIEIESEVFVEIKLLGLLDQDLGEIGIDPPIALVVGMGEVAVANRAANAHVIEFGLHCPQARFDFSQAVAIRQLGERHDTELLGTRVGLDLVVAPIPFDTCLEPPPRNEVHQLRENEFAFVHALHHSP